MQTRRSDEADVGLPPLHLENFADVFISAIEIIFAMSANKRFVYFSIYKALVPQVWLNIDRLHPATRVWKRRGSDRRVCCFIGMPTRLIKKQRYWLIDLNLDCSSRFQIIKSDCCTLITAFWKCRVFPCYTRACLIYASSMSFIWNLSIFDIFSPFFFFFQLMLCSIKIIYY